MCLDDLVTLKNSWLSSLSYEIQLTKRCNCRCIHCFIESFEEEMCYATFSRIVEQLYRLGVARVILTGGEVLIHHRIADVLTELKRLKISPTIITNGSSLNSDMVMMLKEVGATVGVSLDGSRAFHNFFRGRAIYDAVINTLELCVKSEIDLFLIFSVMKDNQKYLDEIVGIALKHGVRRLYVNPIHSLGNAISLEREGKLLQQSDLMALHHRMIDLSGENIGRLGVYSYGSFRSEVIRHKCLLGGKFGGDCHTNRPPWPNNICFSVNGAIFPLNVYLPESFSIGEYNMALDQLLNDYYGGDKHLNLLKCLRALYDGEIAQKRHEYFDWSKVLVEGFSKYKF